MNNRHIQLLFAVVLLILLAALTDPFMYWMPSMPQMLTLALSTAGLAAWIGFVARERQGDEREDRHRMFAGRVAYLTGLTLLTAGLVLQGFTHTPSIHGFL